MTITESVLSMAGSGLSGSSELTFTGSDWVKAVSLLHRTGLVPADAEPDAEPAVRISDLAAGLADGTMSEES
ncbi:hypothetical protein ACOMHN_015937 [Nucella lapillus]